MPHPYYGNAARYQSYYNDAARYPLHAAAFYGQVDDLIHGLSAENAKGTLRRGTPCRAPPALPA